MSLDALGKGGRSLVAGFALASFLTATFVAPNAFSQGEKPTIEAQRAAPKGVAVVALDGATDEAWALAQSIYGDSGLRPAIDDERARVLAGESPHEGASLKVRDLADLRAAVHGDDVPSRKILASIATEVSASSLLVVAKSGFGVSARLFSLQTGTFDTEPLPFPGRDANGKSDWTAVVSATRTRLGAPAANASASASTVATATPPSPAPEKPKSTSFFTSPWFWGALGVAAVVGTTAYLLAKQTSTTPTSYPLTGKVDR